MFFKTKLGIFLLLPTNFADIYKKKKTNFADDGNNILLMLNAVYCDIFCSPKYHYRNCLMETTTESLNSGLASKIQ